MSSLILTEYRCVCGKLLFKGLLCEGLVEVKCRRCGEVRVSIPEEIAYSRLRSDGEGKVVRVEGETVRLFGCEPSVLLGRLLMDIIPMARDAAPAQPGQYQMKDSTLTLRDGTSSKIAACLIPRTEKGGFAGYTVYAMARE